MDKKDQILHSALELFASRGFDGTSIREIAQLADVNIAMINYYFGSKEKLFHEIIEYKVGYTKERLEEVYANNQLDEMQKIDQVVEIYVERIVLFPSFHRLIQQEMMFALRPELQDSIINIFKRNKVIVQNIIRDGIQKHIFCEVDLQLTVATLIGTINQLMNSKTLCGSLLDKGKDFDPSTDKIFHTRLKDHLKQIMRAHLLKSK